ncbi:MAG: hypothetical protein AB7S41_18420 [Parvibaculaceae bacterium]
MRKPASLLGVAALGLSLAAATSLAVAKEVKFRGDGRSIRTAITILNAGSHYMGVHMEYVYVRQKLPGCKVVQQSLLEKNGRFYDELVLGNCRTKVLYFDVTQFLRPKKRR